MYIIKYEQKIQANQKNKILDQKDIELLEFLEKTLTLESILDVRNMLKDKYKVLILIIILFYSLKSSFVFEVSIDKKL